jgi:hypothetical protein
MARRRLHATLIAGTLLLAACGGDGTDDRFALTKIIKDGGRDPATICEHLSDPLLKRLRSVEDCRRAAKAAPAAGPGVTIESLTITGDRAAATVSGADGRTRITFVKDEGSWKVLATG